MQTIELWAKAIGIAPEQIQNWQKEAGPNENVLVWCLAQRKVDVQKYFSWAREHFGLPSIDQEFFKSPADSDLFSRLQNLGPWSETLLPLGQWEGTIFVGCVEPVNSKIMVSHLMVLADPVGLKRHYTELMKKFAVGADDVENAMPSETVAYVVEPTKVAPKPASTPEPEPGAFDQLESSISMGTKETAPDGLTLNIDLSQVNFSAPAGLSTESVSELPNVPEGMNLTAATSEPEVKEDTFNFSFDAEPEPEKISEENSVTRPPAIEENTSASLEFNIDQEEVVATEEPVVEVVESAELPTPEEEAAPMEATTLDVNSAAEPSAEVAAQDSESWQNHNEEPGSGSLYIPPEEDNSDIMSQVNIDTATSLTMNTDTFIGRLPKKLEIDDSLPRSLMVAKNEDEMVGLVFDRLNKVFKKSIIFRCRGNEARVWKFDQNWNPPKGNDPVTFENPSVFRIVMRSSQAYHGPVYASEANDKFFKSWNTPLPEHATVVPLFAKGKVVAMLMTIGTKDNYDFEHLALVEKYRDELQNALVNIAMVQGAA